jgi:putative tricarboxylic transport membrane protein
MRGFALYCNLFWLLFSLFTCVEAYRLGLGSINNPGPGFFPFGAGFIMLILSLAALLQSTKKRHPLEKETHQEPFRWWNIVIILALITGYAFSLEKIGFLINTFLLMCLLLKVVEPQSWKTTVIGGLLTAVAANLIFNVIFQAHIPSGILGF